HLWMTRTAEGAAGGGHQRVVDVAARDHLDFRDALQDVRESGGTLLRDVRLRDESAEAQCPPLQEPGKPLERPLVFAIHGDGAEQTDAVIQRHRHTDGSPARQVHHLFSWRVTEIACLDRLCAGRQTGQRERTIVSCRGDNTAAPHNDLCARQWLAVFIEHLAGKPGIAVPDGPAGWRAAVAHAGVTIRACYGGCTKGNTEIAVQHTVRWNGDVNDAALVVADRRERRDRAGRRQPHCANHPAGSAFADTSCRTVWIPRLFATSSVQLRSTTPPTSRPPVSASRTKPSSNPEESPGSADGQSVA